MKICDAQEFSLSQVCSHLISPLTLFLSNHARLGDAGPGACKMAGEKQSNNGV